MRSEGHYTRTARLRQPQKSTHRLHRPAIGGRISNILDPNYASALTITDAYA